MQRKSIAKTLPGLTAILLLCLLPVSALDAVPQEPQPRTILGVVTSLKKYEFEIQSADKTLVFQTTPDTTFRQRIVRPEFDWENGRIVCEFPATGTPANGNENRTLDIAIGKPLYIRASFQHETEMIRCWESGGQRRLPNYLLTKVPPSEEFFQPSPGRLELLSRIDSIDSRNIASLNFGEVKIRAVLLDRDSTVADSSIADLEPLNTWVEVTAHKMEGGNLASEVVFTRLVDPVPDEIAGLPRCLVLGDGLSMMTLVWLRTQHGQKMNFWHPPENCRGGENADRIPLWLGPWQSPGRQWDVIVFNFGLDNLDTPDEEYSRMLIDWITPLQKTGAKLVWVASVPKRPQDFGTQTESLQRLNRIAAGTLEKFPEIEIIDPSTGVSEADRAALKPAAWVQHLATRLGEALAEKHGR